MQLKLVLTMDIMQVAVAGVQIVELFKREA
jgi:hypothetical protein